MLWTTTQGLIHSNARIPKSQFSSATRAWATTSAQFCAAEPNSKFWDPDSAQHCTCMKAEDKILWYKTRNHWCFTPAHRRRSYLHEHVIDPSHSMGCSNVLLPVPLVQQRTTVCLPLLLREVFPRFNNSIYYLRKRTCLFHLSCLLWFRGFCFVMTKTTVKNKPQ